MAQDKYDCLSDFAKTQKSCVQMIAHLHVVKAAALVLLDMTNAGSLYLGHTDH